MIEKAFFSPQAAMEADISTQLPMVFPPTVWLKVKFSMFLLSSKTRGTGGKENHLDKHYTYTKGEQQNFGNDVPRISFPWLFVISFLYTNAHIH